MRAGRLSIVVVAGILTACGGSEQAATRSTDRRAPSPSTSAPRPVPSTSPSPTLPTPSELHVGIGDARQVISVIADADGATTATFRAYERGPSGWRDVFGPWTANIGERGFAPPGSKREGDGRTPTGVYPFDFFFGVRANPGVRFPYREVTGPSIVWDDDPASPRYNLWTDSATEAVGRDPEPMYNTPAYNYGAVIAYNADRTPGLGSAIFLHVSTGGATAGCVAVTELQLVEVLRWLDPAQQPRIVLGTRAAIMTELV